MPCGSGALGPPTRQKPPHINRWLPGTVPSCLPDRESCGEKPTVLQSLQPSLQVSGLHLDELYLILFAVSPYMRHEGEGSLLSAVVV